MADFLTRIGRSLGISNEEGAKIATLAATGNIPQAVMTTVTSLGGEGRFEDRAADVSAPPAGVDSPATLSPLSQTSGAQRGPTFGQAGGFGSTMSAPNTAFIGGFGIPGIVGNVGRLLSRPGVGTGITGIGAGFVADTVIDNLGRPKKFIITRKLQRDTKKLFMMLGGNLNMLSQQSNFFLGRNYSEEQLLAIMFKTFKNQGPYVTKAAVRKTRSTIRKMETLCDLKDRLCPPKPARRRAPARRMSTSITQVK